MPRRWMHGPLGVMMAIAILTATACMGTVHHNETPQLQGTSATLVSGEQLYINGAQLFNAASTFYWEQVAGPSIPIADPTASDLLVTAPDVTEATFIVLNLQAVTSGANASVLFTITVIPADTGGEATCGDGTCGGGESCETCSADCGQCPDPGPVCGDSACDSTESCETCSADCGACDPGSQTCGEVTPAGVSISDMTLSDWMYLIDGDLSTRWSEQGNGSWAQIDLGSEMSLQSVELSFYLGDSRQAYFDIETSSNGVSWQTALSGGVSSGTTLGAQSFAISGTARFVRYVGYGNSANDWNSLTEFWVTACGDLDGGGGSPSPSCGDNVCDSLESCSSCEQDCGACPVDDGLHSDFGPTKNIWIDRSKLLTLPTSGGAWSDLVADATSSWGSARISNQDSYHDVDTLAGALYAVRMNDTSMRNKVVSAIEDAIGSEDDDGSASRTLALARNLLAYVIAADLVGYRTASFEQWLRDVRHTTLSGRTLISTHEDRPNNWGTHAGASRMGVALYLGDTQDMDRATAVFKGFLGDRSAYNDFSYGDLTWQSNPSAPVGINPVGAKINGLNVDGVLPDDQRRCNCSVSLPFSNENYVYEAMQGVLTQAYLVSKHLRNKGQDGSAVFGWSDEAIRRAWVWLYDQNDFPAAGDDRFLTFMADAAYGTNYSSGVSSTSQGKSIGYTDWTHAN